MPASPGPPPCGLIPGPDSDEVMPNWVSRSAGFSASIPGFVTMDWAYPTRILLTMAALKTWFSSRAADWFGSMYPLLELFSELGLDHEEWSRYQLASTLSFSESLTSPRTVT